MDEKKTNIKQKNPKLTNLLNELKTTKKKIQNIVIQLNQKSENDNETKYIENLILEATNQLNYCCDFAKDAFDDVLQKKIKIKNDQNQTMDDFSNQKNSTFENTVKNEEIESENNELKTKILKIYQYEEENNLEDDLIQNNYNSKRKPPKKCDSELMKELTVFLDKNKPKLDEEIIDFSNKSNNGREVKKEKGKSIQPRIKLNLNDFLISNNKNSSFLKPNE